MGRPKMTDITQFTHNGCDKEIEPLHYTMCGLDNIYLVNGFTKQETKYGKGVSIKDADELHDAIGMYLTVEKKALSSKDTKFLRKQVHLTQAELGEKLSVDSQTVARWEKAETTISGPAENLLRIVYLAHKHPDFILQKVKEIMKELRETDEEFENHLNFETGPDGWKSAA